MISQVFGTAFFLVIAYIVAIFMAPTTTDRYGNKEFNAKIREFKDQSLQFASGGESSPSIVQKITDTTTPYIEDTKKTVENMNSNITTKINQIEEASIAVHNAYSGVVSVAHTIQNLTGSGK